MIDEAANVMPSEVTNEVMPSEAINEVTAIIKECQMNKDVKYAPVIAILLFSLLFMFLVISFAKTFYVPWIPILLTILVLILCIFDKQDVAWFIVIFLISIMILFCIIIFPIRWVHLVLAILVILLTVYGILTKRYYWTAPLLALLISWCYIFFLT